MVLSCNLKRVNNVFEIGRFLSLHYAYNKDRAMDEIERYVQAIDMRKAPLLSMQGEVPSSISPSGYVP